MNRSPAGSLGCIYNILSAILFLVNSVRQISTHFLGFHSFKQFFFICPHITDRPNEVVREVKFPSSDLTEKVQGRLTCKRGGAGGFLYVVQETKSGGTYLGESGQLHPATRGGQHRRAIQDEDEAKAVGKYFSEKNATTESMRFMVRNIFMTSLVFWVSLVARVLEAPHPTEDFFKIHFLHKFLKVVQKCKQLPIKLIGLGAVSVKKSLFQNIQGSQALVCQVFGVCGCRWEDNILLGSKLSSMYLKKITQ